MALDHFIDPKHWRDRAQEARLVADQLTDPEARRMMYEIAADYDRLANRAAERMAKPQPE